jgi:peroxisomal coenzyme A diphosphatase NUDT7
LKLNDILETLTKRNPNILGMDEFLQFAVLVPLVQKQDELHVLFEVRAHHLRRQPGEICFPGGKIEPNDSTPQDAAVRETTEELGIENKAVENVKPLDYIVSQFGTIIYPYIGVLKDDLPLRPNPSEVAEIFTVPLSFFKENPPEVHHIHFKVEPDSTFPFDDIIGGEDYNWQTRKMEEHFYYYENRVIWGLTAKILHHFTQLLNK